MGRRNLLKWTPGALTAGLLLSPRSTGAEERSNSGDNRSVDVKDFGAIGDGLADDSPAIRKAMDHAAASGIGLVRVPGGTYALHSSLPLRNGVYVQGNGPGATQMKSMGNFPVFREMREANNPFEGGVSDLMIRGGGKSNNGAHGIETRFSNRCRFENISFRSCRYAMSIAHAWQMFCLNLSVEGAGADQNYVGWWMHETDMTHIDNAVQAVNCNVQGVEKFGFRLINFQGSKFVNCEACGDMEHGWYLGDPSVGDTKVCWGLFSNCLADSTRSDGWRISRGQASELKEVQFSNCWSGNTGGHGVRVQGADGIVFSNWLVIEPYQCGMEFDGCTRIACNTNSIRQFNRSGKGFAGINLANSSQNIVANNHCHSTNTGGDGGRGIDENGDSDWNIVTSNHVSGALPRGEHSQFENNIGA